MKEIEVYHAQSKKMMKCCCFNYNQFEMDCDKLTEERYKNFNVNPKNRFETRVESVVEQLVANEKPIPSLICLRLESRHAICNCRIDYTFEVFDMETLKNDLRKSEFTDEEWKQCETSNADYVFIYVGMNK